MKTVSLTLLMASLVCAGCATTQDDILKAKGSAQNVEFTSDGAQQGVVGFRATNVRVSRGGNSRTAAACDLTGDGFAATFTAPAVLNLPSYGKQTKPIRVECRVDDELHVQTVEPRNISAENRRANAVGAGVLVGGVLGGALAGSVAGEKEGDAYSYKPITLKVD